MDRQVLHEFQATNQRPSLWWQNLFDGGGDESDADSVGADGVRDRRERDDGDGDGGGGGHFAGALAGATDEEADDGARSIDEHGSDDATCEDDSMHPPPAPDDFLSRHLKGNSVVNDAGALVGKMDLGR